jgi:signal transduction histidine kinase
MDDGPDVIPAVIAHSDPEEEARLRGAMQGPPDEALAPEALAPFDIEAPIEARGRVIGALKLLGPEPDMGRGADDTAFVKDIGRRIAMFVESKRLYGKAQRAIGARDEFLSIASHELRTPITSLKIQVQLISRGLRGRGRVPLTMHDAAVKADVAERQIDRLSTLIDALLDVSRIGAGQIVLHVEDVDLCRVAREVATRLTDSRGVDGTLIAVEAPEPVLGRWDPMRIEQIITNLLSNALKYGPGRPIKMAIWTNGPSAVLTVKDHGIGIAPESLSRIFDRFERAVSPISYGGLGLGLYITRHIVSAHHGMIDVSSEPGAGAEFRVTLPLDAGAEDAEGAPVASAQV